MAEAGWALPAERMAALDSAGQAVTPGAGERRLLMLAVFFGGWNLLRIGTVNVTLSDLAMLACLALAVRRGRFSLMPFGQLTPYWLLGLMLMLGGLFLSSLINGDPLRWANVASQYILAYFFVPVLLLQQEERFARRLCLLFVLGIALSEAIGIVATFFLTYHQTLRYLGDGFITGNSRLGAMSGQPNPNGGAVAFSVPMLMFAVRQKVVGVVPALVCGIVLLWGLLLSASFTGFFATAMGIGIVLSLIGFRLMMKLGIAALVAAALFVASGAPLPAAFQKRVGNALESGDISEAGTYLNRADLIKEAWGHAEKTAVIGMGVDEYREFSQYDNPVHDLYLLIWNEGGAVGIAGLLTLLVLLVAMATGAIPRRREEAAMACAVVAVFLIYTVSYPHMYQRSWVMPIMLALGTIYCRRETFHPA